MRSSASPTWLGLAVCALSHCTCVVDSGSFDAPSQVTCMFLSGGSDSTSQR